MAYSFTEKKRIRKNFGKRPSILGYALPAGDPIGFVPAILAGGHRGIQTR